MIATDTFEGPVTDGEHILDSKAPYSLDAVVSITFYSDDTYETPVLPTGGSCEFLASEDGFNYGTITNGTLTFPVAKYDRPYLFGYVSYLKCILTSITGATHFKMRLHNDGGT